MTAPILVVDDDDDVRSFLVDALDLAGHDVDEAPDGRAALKKLRATGYAVVLTDLTMPGMTGLELLAAIKADQPEVEVVMLTGNGSVGTAVDAMKAGAFDYLTKPISSPAELRLIIDRALERRRLTARAQVPTDGPQLTWGAPAMTPVVDALQKVAATDATVLLTGESGVGKEVAARALHRWSRRRDGPFVAINCAALSEQLIASELFGHERGAFTGATERKRGKLELAEGGTFFLDEVGELKPDLQAKLLRVLQERTFERVGGTRTLPCDVRWVAATNRDLPARIAAGAFRQDLYHRLAVFPVHLPPLRERREDLPELARTLLARAAANVGRPDLTLTPEALATLTAADWPGNARELANALERAAILADGAAIRPEHILVLPGTSTPPAPDAPTMEQAEIAAIRAALARHDGNRKAAAAHLGIGLRTLYDKLKKYGLG
jgi:two-component system response regulator AtoC